MPIRGVTFAIERVGRGVLGLAVVEAVAVRFIGVKEGLHAATHA